MFGLLTDERDILMCVLLIFLTWFAVAYINVDAQNQTMGGVICKESYGDNAEFVDFDMGREIVDCVISDIEKFDGGHVRIKRDSGDE